MRRECECHLPYVDMKNPIICVQCGFANYRSITSKLEYTKAKIAMGKDEYKKGDIVEVVYPHFWCFVKINKFIQKGWYEVTLPNGGIYETQILGKIIK